jgi:hypothetical protein
VVIVQNFYVLPDASNIGGFHCTAGNVTHKLINRLYNYSFEISLAFHIIPIEAVEVKNYNL